jgi:hypothetical protein
LQTRRDYPTLSDLRRACDELNAPFVREIERRAAHDNQLLLAPASRLPRTPEQQARIDAQLSDEKMRRIRGGALAPERQQAPLPKALRDAPISPERRARLLADLSERKARNEANRTQPAAAPPGTTKNVSPAMPNSIGVARTRSLVRRCAATPVLRLRLLMRLPS